MYIWNYVSILSLILTVLHLLQAPITHAPTHPHTHSLSLSLSLSPSLSLSLVCFYDIYILWTKKIVNFEDSNIRFCRLRFLHYLQKGIRDLKTKAKLNRCWNENSYIMRMCCSSVTNEKREFAKQKVQYISYEKFLFAVIGCTRLLKDSNEL